MTTTHKHAKVKVDLVAPEIFGYPVEYRQLGLVSKAAAPLSSTIW